MKIAYAGFDLHYPSLESLEAAGCEVMRVFTYPTDNVYEFNRQVTGFAEARGIPWTDARVTSADLNALWEAGCEALFSAGYIYRIPVDTPLRCANVHPALLPLGRGPWPMPCTILRGLSESGVTIHKVAAGLDTGDILLQESFPVTGRDTLETMTETIRALAPRLAAQTARSFDRLWEEAVPQGEGEYWKEPTEEEMTFTPRDSLERVDRIVRAFAGYGSFLRLGEETLTVVRGEVIPGGAEAPPGALRMEHGVPQYALEGGWLRLYESRTQEGGNQA